MQGKSCAARAGAICLLALLTVLIGCQRGRPPEVSDRSDLVEQLLLNLGDGVTLKCAKIPAGTFLMGSPPDEAWRQPDEGPQRVVTISKPFFMGVYEVTRRQYKQVMGECRGDTLPGYTADDNCPVEYVTWVEAVLFCELVTKRTGCVVRLPTEAEWEYACRAGANRRFCFGDKEEDLTEYEEYARDENRIVRVAPVGSYFANTWGLYDVHGNVWEWCWDWYSDSYSEKDREDPVGPEDGSERVLRGGGWDRYAFRASCASRYAARPRTVMSHVGFRVQVECSE